MADDGNDDKFEQFLRMTKSELVNYLAARGITTTGGKQSLVARAFVAWENGVQIKLSTEEFQNKLSNDYKNMLQMHNIPDPLTLPQSMWSTDVTKWPLVDMGKIFKYILKTKDYNTDYIGKYKTQKAYSYFASKFVGTVFSSRSSNLCILTGEVTPSQSVRGDAHKVWILVDEMADPVTSWCSCTAGFCQTCNHVIAVLYKVEYAVANHLNSASCTEQACQWNKSTKKTIAPGRVCDMDFRSDVAGCINSEMERKRRRLEKANFDPRRDTERVKNPKDIANFIAGLSEVAPKSAFFKGLAPQLQTKNSTSKSFPKTMQEIANDASASTTTEVEACRLFNTSLCFTAEQCQLLEMSTRGQSSSQLWKDQRLGRITGSNVHRVAQKVNELLTKKTAVVTPLVHALISGGPDISHIPAVQWGIQNEGSALQEFLGIMKQKHVNLTVKPAGLYVDRKNPYIGASPDGIVKCDCHGLATLEIKCPFKLKGKDLKLFFSETDFLIQTDDGITLKRDHKYFSQVQSQLAVTGHSFGYFCVSSINGQPLIITIEKDHHQWDETEKKLVLFFKAFLQKFLLGQKTLSFCIVCDKLCLDINECKVQGDKSVSCDTCNLWFHWSCQNYTGNDKFVCSFCLAVEDDNQQIGL